jgi:DNA-binding NtrC family response regulator
MENTMHRAVLLAHGELIGAEAIELPIVPNAEPIAAVAEAAPIATPANALKPVTQLVGQKMEVVERDLILETLTHCLGNRTRAAEILGISIRTLRNKLHDYRAQGVSVPAVPGMLPPGFYAQGF